MSFNDNGIALISHDQWVAYYHTMLSDPMAKKMIENRLSLNQVVEYDGRFGLNHSNSKDCDPNGTHQTSMFRRSVELKGFIGLLSDSNIEYISGY
jgi:hypothetical protein